MRDLKFGTSGLRGLVVDLTDEVCAAYTAAFLKHLALRPSATLLVGYDLRDSSPRIAKACMAAAVQHGVSVENCGPLPTPALALRAMTVKAPAIMVTGSHIPADRNGLKFYRADGEIDKQDEQGILAALDIAAPPSGPEPSQPAILSAALEAYQIRCASLIAADSLAGKTIGVYQHSSVARDLMVELLESAGAKTVVIARSDVFVPVDTEALRPEDEALALEAARSGALDAIVSTDGDADRPLIADETGRFLRGDTVGLLTARFLEADAVVTPVTSNSAVELCREFGQVVRTKVGSPYVIAGMQDASADGFERVVGFEANGGVLLGSAVTVNGLSIDALPTRDAMLPILAVLGLAARDGVAVSALPASLPARVTRSGRLEHVPAAQSGQFLADLADAGRRRSYFADLGTEAASDSVDGIRTVIAGNDVLHYRASGNAPELRCYAEAGTAERADELLRWGLARARSALQEQGVA